MPKSAVHEIVLRQTTSRLALDISREGAKIGDILNEHRNTANLGAIGPDLFFWAPDYEIVRIPLQLYRNLEPLITLYNNTIGKVKEAIRKLGEPIEDALETLAPATVQLIKALIAEVKETTKLFQATIQTGIFVGVFEGYDFFADAAKLPTLAHQLFDKFTPPLQPIDSIPGKPENYWYWFDMLHYRKTGTFAKQLLKAAGNDKEKLAYAYSWLTHIATDTVGHSYVNRIVGGPYRLRPHRHATCENFIDSWCFKKYYNKNIVTKLHEELTLNDNLSTKIGDMLYQVFINTYTDAGFRPNNFLTRDNIDETFTVFAFVMKVLGSMGIEEPEEPFSNVWDILNSVFRSISSPPSPPSASNLCPISDIFGNFGDCWSNFIKQLGDYFKWLAELTAWSFKTILILIDFLQAMFLSIPIILAMAVLFAIQVLLYRIFRDFRFALTLEGFLYPYDDELNNNFAASLVTPGQCSLSSMAHGLVSYPFVHNHYINNLQCPILTPELPKTFVSKYGQDRLITPQQFIELEPFRPELIEKYIGANASNSSLPNYISKIHGGHNEIGNATDFSVWMIRRAANISGTDGKREHAFANWNLDSDRGYGFKCWKAKLNNGEVSNIDWID